MVVIGDVTRRGVEESQGRDGERGDPVIGCRPSGTFRGARITGTNGSQSEAGRRLRARDFEDSGQPERLRSWVVFGSQVAPKGCCVRVQLLAQDSGTPLAWQLGG